MEAHDPFTMYAKGLEHVTLVPQLALDHAFAQARLAQRQLCQRVSSQSRVYRSCHVKKSVCLAVHFHHFPLHNNSLPVPLLSLDLAILARAHRPVSLFFLRHPGTSLCAACT